MNRKIWLGFSILGDPVSKSGKNQNPGKHSKENDFKYSVKLFGVVGLKVHRA
jgi:hypothetical protein